MLDEFEKYLEDKGYSKLTPSGLPSTTVDYAQRRIPQICKRENVTVDVLAQNIDKYVKKYDITGTESAYGNKSKRAYINSLKRFQEFLAK